jgi:hypothetical protein
MNFYSHMRKPVDRCGVIMQLRVYRSGIARAQTTARVISS